MRTKIILVTLALLSMGIWYGYTKLSKSNAMVYIPAGWFWMGCGSLNPHIQESMNMKEVKALYAKAQAYPIWHQFILSQDGTLFFDMTVDQQSAFKGLFAYDLKLSPQETHKFLNTIDKRSLSPEQIKNLQAVYDKTKLYQSWSKFVLSPDGYNFFDLSADDQKVIKAKFFNTRIPADYPDRDAHLINFLNTQDIDIIVNAKKCPGDEKPYHKVYLDAYYIDKNDVTVNEYTKCVQAGKCTEPQWNSCYVLRSGGNRIWGIGVASSEFQGGNHPVVCVDWYQANTYCSWMGMKLPTEAQWAEFFCQIDLICTA